MKKSVLFLGAGVLLTSFLTFGFRSINKAFFQSKLTGLIFFGAIGIALLFWGLIGKGK